MLSAYIQAAMRRAKYEILDDQPDSPFYGEIPELRGVWANAPTLEACREDLQDALEGWIWLGLRLGHDIPVLDNIDLNNVQPISEAA
jgi:predicted RNase H-like HicB family nuclease